MGCDDGTNPMPIELREERVSHDGQTFVYLTAGEGSPVVLVHGFPDGPQAWTATALALVAAGHRVLAPYLRGYHPDNVVPGRGYGGEELGEDVIRFMDALGVERAALVGHDWGAASVQTATNLAPHRVTKLVSVAIPHARALKPSPALARASRHFVYFKLPWAEAATRRADFAYLDRIFTRWAPNWSGPQRDAQLAAAKQRFRDPRVLDGAMGAYRALRAKPSPTTAKRIEVPTLLIGGKADLGGDPAPFLASDRGFVGEFELLLLDGVGHWPHCERPDEVIPAIVAAVADA